MCRQEILLHRLTTEIEYILNKKIETPKDFDFLSKCIYERVGVLISSTTLKRIWGYISDNVSPRKSTLDYLAKFLGYNNWDEFEHNDIEFEGTQSSPILSRRINVLNDLIKGQKIRLLWAPLRVCEIEYLGKGTFKVLNSKNTRLLPLDTFQCFLFIEGEPLYIDNLIQGNSKPVGYVCGKKSGIQFELF